MKVAIIGGGVAGLSCAHELERYGIKAHIYERHGYIGEQYPHVVASLEIINRPIKDFILYIKKNYEIDIKPINTIDTLVHYSPRIKTTIKGDFGYLLKRGKDKDSIKNQLLTQLNTTEVFLNKFGDYKILEQTYDYVVIANGSSAFTEELGCWQNWVNTYVRGAVVLGDFDPNTLIVWINKDYCKNGYAYLTPFNDKKASLILVVTDIVEKQVDLFWDYFLYKENINYKMVEEFKLEHTTGFVYPKKFNNLYFAGNSCGGIDPFLGFGQLKAIIQGVMAAKAIVEGKDYHKLLKKLTKENLNLHEFRKALNNAENLQYDLMITSIGIPGIKHLMYYTPLNVVKVGGSILGVVNKLSNKGRKQM